VKKPSQSKNGYWIYAHPPRAKSEQITTSAIKWFEENADSYLNSGKIYPRDIYLDEMVKPKTDIEKTLMMIDHETIKIAKRKPPETYIFLGGKWLIFTPRSMVDEIWEKISSAIESGNLPYHAKVATAKESPFRQDDRHVICVYTPNFLYRDDVRNCRIVLKKLGFQSKLYYKPDIFTLKHMYRIYGSKINHRYFG